MVKPRDPRKSFDLQDYYDHPEDYVPVLEEYIPQLTVLVNAIYWSPLYPRFVTKAYLKSLFGGTEAPRLRVIGDLSCDVNGGMECTVKCTNPAEPVFAYDVENDEALDGVIGRGPVVMAIDNLPAEISLESSVFFSRALKPFVPALAAADFGADFSRLSLPFPLKKAVILHRGELTPDYSYLRNFLSQTKRSHP